MLFENYARDWLDRQTFSKSIRKKNRQSVDYICKAIGGLEIEDISESDIDEIFYDEQLFRRQIDFMERTFRVLNKIFDEIRENGLRESDPVLHI